MTDLAQENQAGAPVRRWRPATWLSWAAYSLFVGSVVAVAVQTILFGRTPLQVVARGWLANPLLLAVLLLVFVWWMTYGRIAAAAGIGAVRAVLLPGMPLLAFTALPLGVIHLSDTANHHFYYGLVELSQPKGLSVLLLIVTGTVLLQAAAVGARRDAGAVSGALQGVRSAQEPVTLGLLLAIGVFQSTAYIPPPGMDFLRYWLIADALGQGLPYAASTVMDAGKLSAGMTAFVVDLPLYPTTIVMSFLFFGHTVGAAYLPLSVCNALIPPVTYLLYREFIPNRLAAISLTGLIVLFPLLRFYTLNFPVPDPVYLASLVSCALMFVRTVKGQRGMFHWVAFGVLAGMTALGRMEGAAYASLYVLVAIVSTGTLRQKAALLSAFLAPVMLYSATLWRSFGTLWPPTLGGALSVTNLKENLPVLVTDEFFTSAIRMSSEQLAFGWGLLLLLSLAGTLPLVHRPRRLATLFIPAWVNLVMVMLAHPLLSGARLWFDFFRHVSYVLPLFVLAGAVVLIWCLGRLRNNLLRLSALAILNVALFLGVMWNVHSLSKPSWNFGPDAVNIVSQERHNLVDFFTHPYQLPRIEYELSGSHSEPILEGDFFARYPDPMIEFYRPLDAVKLMTGTAYETASLLLYLGALFVAALPCLFELLARRRTSTSRLPLETALE